MNELVLDLIELCINYAVLICGCGQKEYFYFLNMQMLTLHILRWN